MAFPAAERKGPPGVSVCLLGVFVLVSAMAAVTLDHAWAAGPTAPGEQNGGMFYAITHLPLAAYAILLFVFVLAVANLIYQAHIFPSSQPFSAIWAALTGKVVARKADGT